MKKLLAAIAVIALSAVAYAHPGGTDAKGCHYDHRTGVYHCH